MLVLLLMAAGFAFIVGAKSIAGGILKVVLALAVALAAIQQLARCFTCLALSSENTGTSWSYGAIPVIAFLVVLALVGLVAWRRRADRVKARDLWAKRHGTPRTRALPKPPVEDHLDGSATYSA
jgi:MYXO-CTERM domain-containing protein